MGLPSSFVAIASRAGRTIRGPCGAPALLGALTVLAFSLVASRWPLTQAEVWTALNARQPFVEHLRQVAADRHPPVYFLFTWLVHRLDASDGALRAPSIAFAVATVVLLATWGMRVLGRPTALLAAAIVALHPFFLAEGVAARSVSATMALGAAIPFAGIELLRARRLRRPAFLLSGLATLGLYVHYDSALPIAATGLGAWVAAAGPRPRKVGPAVAATAALAASGLAFLPWFLGPIRGQDLYEATARNFQFLHVYLWPVGEGHLASGWWLLPVLGIAGIALAWRDPAVRLLAAALPVAVAIPWVWSSNYQVSFKCYLFAPLFPAWAMLVARGAVEVAARAAGDRPWRARIATAALALLPLLPARSLPNVLRSASSPADVGCPGCWAHDPERDVQLFVDSGIAQADVNVHLFATSTTAYYWAKTGAMPRATTDPDRAWWCIEPRHRGFKPSCGVGEGACEYDGAFAWRVRVRDPDLCARLEGALDRAWREGDRGPYAMGRALRAFERGEPEPALALAAEVVANNPDWIDGVVIYARMLAAAGRTEEATRLLRSAVDGSTAWMPADPSAIEALASLLSSQGSPDAERYLRLSACARTRRAPALCWTPLRALAGRNAAAAHR